MGRWLPKLYAAPVAAGGPNQATEFYAIFLYRNAFAYLRMGKASALA